MEADILDFRARSSSRNILVYCLFPDNILSTFLCDPFFPTPFLTESCPSFLWRSPLGKKFVDSGFVLPSYPPPCPPPSFVPLVSLLRGNVFLHERPPFLETSDLCSHRTQVGFRPTVYQACFPPLSILSVFSHRSGPFSRPCLFSTNLSGLFLRHPAYRERKRPCLFPYWSWYFLVHAFLYSSPVSLFFPSRCPVQTTLC